MFHAFSQDPGSIELTPELAADLLDPEGWRNILQLYAQTTKLAVALCGIAAGPVRLLRAESAAVGRTADESLIHDIEAAARALETMSDAHVSADYRKHLAGVLCGRAMRVAFARIQLSA